LDLDSATPKTYSKHGQTPRSEKKNFFFVAVLSFLSKNCVKSRIERDIIRNYGKVK